VGNGVLHAYAGLAAGAIELELVVDDLQLVVYVRDQGRGMAPPSGSPGLGLGLTLIADSADQLELSSNDDRGTEVCMRFRLRPVSLRS
jgi:anti-sigma regulatory factor (Ser/Thr protein kinase)